jgi:hypothetical protein
MLVRPSNQFVRLQHRKRLCAGIRRMFESPAFLRRAPELTHLYFREVTRAAVAEASGRNSGTREIPTADSVTLLIRN